MGEGNPAGQAMAEPTLDVRATREALLAAGAIAELDAALQRTAGILARHFGADAAVVHVRRSGTSIFVAPLETPMSAAAAEWSEEGGFEQFEDAALGGAFPAGAITVEGVVSSMRLGLRGERGQLIGCLLVGSRKPGRFTSLHLAELLDLGPAASSWIRPAVLVEQLRREHELMEVEATLLAEAVAAETEEALISAVADGVRQALRADIAFVHVHGAGNTFPGASLHCSPRSALSPGQWSEAYRTMQSGGNTLLTTEQPDGSRANPDLEIHAPTPIEVFFRDVCGMRSLLTSVQSHRWGGLGLGLSASRHASGPWTRAEGAFLARLSRVLEISVERLRRGELAIAHAVSLEQQAELLATGEEMLATLSETEDLIAASNRMAERVRMLFDADHVAFGTIDAEHERREWLGISSDVLSWDETSSQIGPEDIAAFGRAMSGQLEVVEDLRLVTDLNPTTVLLRERGMASLIRAPFRLSDGAVGVVTVSSRKRGCFTKEDAERLEDLCRPMGVAIDRVRLLARMAESSRMLEVKTRVLASLGPGATIESAGEVFVTEVRRLFGATHAQVTIGTRTGYEVPAFSSEHLSRDEMLAAMAATGAADNRPASGEPYALDGPYLLPDLARQTA